MLLVILLAALGLTPGAYVAYRVHARHGWTAAVLAGLAVTAAGVLGLLASLVWLTPLAAAATVGCVLLALRAYDAGRVVAATCWASVALFLSAAAGWRR